MALRALAVLLLALLFARPYLTASGGPGQEREVLVLVDQSASMRGPVGQDVLCRGTGRSGPNLEGTPGRNCRKTGVFRRSRRGPAPAARIDPDRQPGFAGTDYGKALLWARDVLELSPRPHRKVFLLTDLQRTGLRRTPCTGFPENVQVEVVAIGQPLSSNVAVEKVDVPEATAGGTQPLVVTAQVSNVGIFAARNIPVTLSLKGAGLKPVEQKQTITIAAGWPDQRRAVPCAARRIGPVHRLRRGRGG